MRPLTVYPAENGFIVRQDNYACNHIEQSRTWVAKTPLQLGDLIVKIVMDEQAKKEKQK